MSPARRPAEPERILVVHPDVPGSLRAVTLTMWTNWGQGAGFQPVDADAIRELAKWKHTAEDAAALAELAAALEPADDPETETDPADDPDGTTTNETPEV